MLTPAWFVETGAAVLVALAVMAAVVFAWRRRAGGAGSLIAGVGAVVCLWLTYRPPVFERVLEPRGAWLRTAGSSAGQGAPGGRDPAEHGRRWQVFSLPGAIPTSEATAIPDVQWLLRHHPEVVQLRVSGHGLAAPEWSGPRGPTETMAAPSGLPWRIETQLPPALAPGFRALNWTRELGLGSELTVRGALGGCPQCTEIRLEGVGAGTGAAAAPAADGGFELRARPRAAGRFLPELVAVDAAGAPVLRQSFDVVVALAAPVAVLWLERAPSFESRAVRHWRENLQKQQPTAPAAADRGRFVLRSVWSRGRARTAALGGPALPARLDQRSLSELDLVVADAESLRALGAAEAAALEQAVRAGGLGLLLRLQGEDRLPASPSLLAGWRVRALEGLDELLARVAWPGFEAAEPLAIAPRELEPQWGTTPLVADRAGRVLAAVRYQGAGAVAVSLLEGTYRWTLAGDREAHAGLWSRLLGAVARPRANAWRVPAGPVLVDWPLDLELSVGSAVEEISCREPDGATVALPFSTRPEEPARALARFWPRLTGWHLCTAILAGEAFETQFFAHPEEPWRVWLDGRRHDATAIAAALTAAAPANAGPSAGLQSETLPLVRRPPVRRPVALPRWPFYAAFLLAVGYLWAAERWRGASPHGITDDQEIPR